MTCVHERCKIKIFGFLTLLHRSPAVHLFLEILATLAHSTLCEQRLLLLEFSVPGVRGKFVHKITEHSPKNGTLFGQCDLHDLCFESLECAFSWARELRSCIHTLFCSFSCGGDCN